MSFSLKPGKPIRRELKRIVRRQLRGTLAELASAGGGHVHEARKHVKKARAVAALLRQADTTGVRKDERRLRTAGRVLSELRDADAVQEALERLRQQFPTRLPPQAAALMRSELERTKRRRLAGAKNHRRLVRAARTLRAVRRSAVSWKVPRMDAGDLPGLLKTVYRRAHKAMRRPEKRARPSDLHRWRKRVKALWYPVRLLEKTAPALRPMTDGLEQLERVLGEHHDLSMLRSVLAKNKVVRRRAAHELGVLAELSIVAQGALRRKALALGRRLLGGRPKLFARRVRAALSVSTSHGARAPRESARTAA